MRKLTHLEYFKKIQDVHNGSIIIMGQYIDSRHKIFVQCKKCQHQWNVNPRSLYSHGCPQCGEIIAKNTKKWNISDEYFLRKIPNNLLKRIKILSSYESVRSQHLMSYGKILKRGSLKMGQARMRLRLVNYALLVFITNF